MEDWIGLNSDAPTEDPVRFYGTMVVCASLPLAVALLLPEPWFSAFVPLAAFILIFGFFFGFALLLHGLSVVWRLLRPHHATPFQCPSCLMSEEPAFPFVVVRVAPAIFRVRCRQCGDRWIERR